MHFLTINSNFPDVSMANEDGLLAIGGDLTVERLIEAYKSGIFPWYETGQPVLWWSPDPRFVLFPNKLKVSKSMRQILKNSNYTVTVNKDFRSVITECAIAKREGQSSTWITNEMIEAYCDLHNLGFAKSVEVWRENKLVAGLYGVDLNGEVFSGESMFTKESNASKVGFITFVNNSNYSLIDCQVHTSHLESLGAEYIARSKYIKSLN
ncbi:leucyl/phenylalanyl-tRNA--protein transferase [Pontimicrobium sp. SW4]|uniref:Leucyl/phenylalanyl-tRNA--protein transferase n=1 Tax=Pontimicrobium sp. SW4 TaxID=3153519 RepID=A0AAU7BSR2_9FLAO